MTVEPPVAPSAVSNADAEIVAAALDLGTAR